MKDLLERLARIEDHVGEYYRRVAGVFAGDGTIRGLAVRLARDEAVHARALRHAAHMLRDADDLRYMMPDEGAVSAVEEKVSGYVEAVRAEGFGRSGFIESLLELEFGEVNSVFLHVLKVLARLPDLHDMLLENVDGHVDLVRSFLDSHEEYAHIAGRFREITELRREMILLVEGELEMVEMCRVFLESEGVVDVASSGTDALEMIKSKLYSAVVTGVDIPAMDGMELYRRAVRERPYLRDRFLFLVEPGSAGRVAEIEESGLRHLMRPASIRDKGETWSRSSP